jgi:hypothetical protein
VSRDLAVKLRLGLNAVAAVHGQFDELLSLPDRANPGVIERSAACAMLHSFYTEIEKLLKLIAREWDGRMPDSDAWHKELLLQMSMGTDMRPAVLSAAMVAELSEYLAFRHLFRGASIVLMRWEKLLPLLSKAGETHRRVDAEVRAFIGFVEATPKPENQ